jgi:hypothetical protein
MDKSFNDQELSDIMKEIEALEEEFSGEEDSDKIQASAIMEELADMDEFTSIPETNKHDNVVAFEKKTTPHASKKTGSTSMAFKVQGDLNLELQFEVNGKSITLDVSENGFNIQMEGGVTFSVPLSDAHSLKKAV